MLTGAGAMLTLGHFALTSPQAPARDTQCARLAASDLGTPVWAHQLQGITPSLSLSGHRVGDRGWLQLPQKYVAELPFLFLAKNTDQVGTRYCFPLLVFILFSAALLCLGMCVTLYKGMRVSDASARQTCWQLLVLGRRCLVRRPILHTGGSSTDGTPCLKWCELI